MAAPKKKPAKVRASAEVKADAAAVEGGGKPATRRKKKLSREELVARAQSKKTSGPASDESGRTPEQEARYQQLADKLRKFQEKQQGGSGGAAMLVGVVHKSQLRRAEAMGLPPKPVPPLPGVSDFELSSDELEACAISLEILALELFPTAMGFSPAWAAVFVLGGTLGLREYSLWKIRKTLEAMQAEAPPTST